MGISKNEPLPEEFKRNIPRAKAAIEKKRLDEVDRTSGWNDNMLCQPFDSWESSDKRGVVGNGKRLFSAASERYQRNFVNIDWSA